jgi:hypothetical protein
MIIFDSYLLIKLDLFVKKAFEIRDVVVLEVMNDAAGSLESFLDGEVHCFVTVIVN